VAPERSTLQKLRDAQSYNRSIIEASSTALLVVDANLRVTDANERATALTHRPRQELIGSPIDAEFDFSPRSMAVARKTLETGESSRFELVVSPRSGKARSVAVSASRFIDPMGEHRGIFLIDTL